MHELPSLGQRVGLCQLYPCPSAGLDFSVWHGIPKWRLELLIPSSYPVLSARAFFSRASVIKSQRSSRIHPEKTSINLLHASGLLIIES